MSQNRFCEYIKYFVHRSNLPTFTQPPSHRYHAIRKKKRVKKLDKFRKYHHFLTSLLSVKLA